MAPKAPAQGGKGATKAPSGPSPSILETCFPIWNETTVLAEKESSDKFIDSIVGASLPLVTEEFMDAWKRPEELVMNMPDIPMLRLKPAHGATIETKDAKGKTAPPPATREHEGQLYAGHKSFEWLKSVIESVVSAQKCIQPSNYLWELIYPKADPKVDPSSGPIVSPSGRYRVKLFIMGEWRTVVVDDRVPVDLFGQFLFVGIRPLQLWPLLLSKAILKVMSALRILDKDLPHQVAAFRMLTGWPQEDLVDPLGGTPSAGGFLFDRLEDAVKGNEAREKGARRNVATACLIKRKMPDTPPPRIIVLVGPGAVGVSKILSRVVEAFPDKFGLIMSHTTRPPREHEVHGKNYFFLDKATFQSEAMENKFLEFASVSGIKETYLYGTAIQTVREVAATGRLCLMSLDEQGVKALRANKRIDGLYIYVKPPSEEEHEARIRGRLREDRSTVDKRISWAKEEVANVDAATQAAKAVAAAAKPGSSPPPALFEHVVDNEDDVEKVYYSIKEAISTLSPIIRNRLRGLPGYILDYSDLISPNLVEKPYLKPVVIAGPDALDRRRILLEKLTTEFPDVFAFPRQTTTRQKNELDRFRITELEKKIAKQQMEAAEALARTGRAASPARTGTAGSIVPGMTPLGREGSEFAGLDGDIPPETPSLYPSPHTVTAEEFEALVKSGELVEHHSDLFAHPLMTRQYGVTRQAIKEVIMQGKIPLLVGVESQSFAPLVKNHNIQCLGIFLRPPSIEVHEQRLVEWLSEPDEDVAARLKMAREQGEAALAAAPPSAPIGHPLHIYDHVLTNDLVQDSYDTLVGLLTEYRPDVMAREDDSGGSKSEGEGKKGSEASSSRPLLVLCSGPSAPDAAPVLSSLLSSSYPDTFALPLPLVTDRKPGKGEASTNQLKFIPAKDLAALASSQSLVAQYQEGGGTVAVTSESTLLAMGVQGAGDTPSRVSVIVLPDEASVAAMKAGPMGPGSLFAWVSPPGGSPGEVPEGFDLVLGAEEEEGERASCVRDAMTKHTPQVVKPPSRPMVVCGPFGTGRKVLLQKLLDSIPGKFSVPAVTTTRSSLDQEAVDQGSPTPIVVSREEAEALRDSGSFLIHEEVLGHIYGITRASVKQVMASARVLVLDIDKVEDARRLRAEETSLEGEDGSKAGLLAGASFFYIGVDSADELHRRINAELEARPPLGYSSPAEAVSLFFQVALGEVKASREEGLFDHWIDNGSDAGAAFSRLSEAMHLELPSIVPKHFVYGYGKGLWDPSVRVYGQHALRVMVLGPAASGKTTQCQLLSKKFDCPHINVGDLLFEEIKGGTQLGLEAKVFMDASKTVPDHLFITIITERLKRADCLASGWILDGFPHTAPQVAALKSLGIVPDKVIFLSAPNELLLDRTRYRKIDYQTQSVYHMPPNGAKALSPAIIPPNTKEGKQDPTLLSRLYPRHDDSEDNVLARLALWDLHSNHLRAAYEDVSLRLDASGSANDGTPESGLLLDQSIAFLCIESKINDVEVVPSSDLTELQYEIVDAMRYRRRQLVQVFQGPGAPAGRRTYWVDAKDLASNSHCLLLAQDPTQFLPHQQRRRANLSKAPRPLLLLVDSPEPSEVLLTLDLGMQWALEDRPLPQNRLLVITGAAGSGKSTMIQSLLRDFPLRVQPVPVLTSRDPRKGELLPPKKDPIPPGATNLSPQETLEAVCAMVSAKKPSPVPPFIFLGASDIAREASEGEVIGLCQYDGGLYAVGMSDLEKAWEAGLLPVIEAPLALAESLKSASVSPPEKSFEVKCCHLDCEDETLDLRLRSLAAKGAAIEEDRLQMDLQLAKEERTRLQSLASQHEGGGMQVLDRVVNADGGLEEVYSSVRELAASMWYKPRTAAPCQLSVEDFDWKASSCIPPADGSRRTHKLLKSLSCASTRLSLPRGRHLLRVHANHEQLHAVTFHSSTPRVVANEYVEVLKEPEAAQASGCKHVACDEGEYGAMPPSSCQLLFKYNLVVAEPTTLAASLAISGEDLRSCTRLTLVNHADSKGTLDLPLGRLPRAIELQPSPEGYSIVALADVPPSTTLLPFKAQVSAASPSLPPPAPAPGVNEDGSWALTLTSSNEPKTIDGVSSTRAQIFEGAYGANVRGVLTRQVLVPTGATQLSLLVRTTPAVPFTLRLMKMPGAGEVQWGQEYPLAIEEVRSGDDGMLWLPNAILQPGKYVSHMTLDAASCPEGLQPSPIDGRIREGSSIAWRAVYMPSTDDKVCPIIHDDSQQRYFKSMMDSWAGGAPAAAAPAKGAKAPAGGPGAARLAAAAAVMERIKTEIDVAPVRVLKDGSSLPLNPDLHLSKIDSDVKIVVLREALEERVRLQEAAAKEAQGGALVSAKLSEGKGARQALGARRTSEFTEFRAQQANKAQGVLAARKAAALAIQQAQ